MSDVATYHLLVCALFPEQGVMWTQSKCKGEVSTLVYGVLFHVCYCEIYLMMDKAAYTCSR